MAADLLPAPPPRQQLDEHVLQAGGCVEASTVVAGSSRGRVAVGIEGAVAAPLDGVAAQLAGDRRGARPSRRAN
jgi:hypothetical protein